MLLTRYAYKINRHLNVLFNLKSQIESIKSACDVFVLHCKAT